MSIEIKIIVDLKPTEDKEKILNAIKKIFGLDSSNFRIVKENENEYIEYSSLDLSSLNFFKLKIRERNIQAHVRRQLERNLIGNRTTIYLNKQVATVGKVSLCDNPYECPLGVIQLELYADTITELNRLISWLTS